MSQRNLEQKSFFISQPPDREMIGRGWQRRPPDREMIGRGSQPVTVPAIDREMIGCGQPPINFINSHTKYMNRIIKEVEEL
ncbi:MAG: hypothetical protein ACOX5F_00585 [Anaerovoracaceae bacterium]